MESHSFYQAFLGWKSHITVIFFCFFFSRVLYLLLLTNRFCSGDRRYDLTENKKTLTKTLGVNMQIVYYLTGVWSHLNTRWMGLRGHNIPLITAKMTGNVSLQHDYMTGGCAGAGGGARGKDRGKKWWHRNKCTLVLWPPLGVLLCVCSPPQTLLRPGACPDSSSCRPAWPQPQRVKGRSTRWFAYQMQSGGSCMFLLAEDKILPPSTAHGSSASVCHYTSHKVSLQVITSESPRETGDTVPLFA